MTELQQLTHIYQAHCRAPEHLPDALRMVPTPGWHEHTCEACHLTIRFQVGAREVRAC